MGNKGSRMDGSADPSDTAAHHQQQRSNVQQPGQNIPPPHPQPQQQQQQQPGGGDGTNPRGQSHSQTGGNQPNEPKRESVAPLQQHQQQQQPTPHQQQPPPLQPQQQRVYASQQDKEQHESQQLEHTLGEFTSNNATPDVSAHDSYAHWEGKSGLNNNGEDHIGGSNKMNPKLHQTMRQTMRNTMCNGDLRSLVKLPQNADYNEWLALNTIHFYRTCSLIGQNYRHLCTSETCPLMSAGNVEYLWKDNHTYLKPTRVPACQYMEFALCEALACIEDSSIFPIDENQQFTRAFLPKVKEIFKRLFRQFAHLYYSHYEQIKLDGSSKHLNSTFKHFIFFVVEFNLVDAGTMSPLQKFIDHIMTTSDQQQQQQQRGTHRGGNSQFSGNTGSSVQQYTSS